MWNKVITKGPVLYHSTYLRYQKSQIHRDRKENGGYQGLTGRRNEELLFKEYRDAIWEDEVIL